MTSKKRFSFTVLAAILVGAPLVACGGQVSLGDDRSQSQAVDPTHVGVASHACPSGYQHSNICCTGGSASVPAQCESWNDDAFHACQPGWTLYPNQAECCSLANPSQCASCDSAGNCAGIGEPPAGSCQNDRCPPGWNGISPSDPAGCCRYTANGTQDCYGFSAADDGGVSQAPDAMPVPSPGPDAGVDDAGPFDAGPFDASADDAGVNPGGPVIGADGGPDAGPPPPPPMCDDQCPQGWSAVKGEPGICCALAPDGAEQCFSFPVSGGADQPSTGVGSAPSGGSGGGSGSGGSSGGSGGGSANIDAGAAPHP